MSRYLKPFPLLVAVVFLFGLGSGAVGNGEERDLAVETIDETVVESNENVATSPRPVEKATLKPERVAEPNPWHGYENVCETFTVYQSNKRTKKGTYPIRYRRNRYKRKRSDQRRTRDLIRMVAKEMGADPDIVETIAMHESSWNPEAIHILNPDLAANKNAWRGYSYNRSAELKLEGKLKTMSARSKEFWGVKKRLSRMRLYKPNSYWDAKLRYEYVLPQREVRKAGGGTETIPQERIEEWASVWTYGYGLYGMNAILYTHIWDRSAPPWVLCGDEGIVSTVTAIWALRSQQRECADLTSKNPEKYGTDGGNARGVVRRFARGQCSDKRLGKAWRSLMASRSNVDWDGPVDLGTKWPRWETKRKKGKLRYVRDENNKKIRTDRLAVLNHMRAKAKEKGLLRETPLERKRPESAPVIAMKNR